VARPSSQTRVGSPECSGPRSEGCREAEPRPDANLTRLPLTSRAARHFPSDPKSAGPQRRLDAAVLKRKENLTAHQQVRLRDLLRYNLQTVRAYLLKKDFQQFWTYNSPTWAGMFLDFWCYQTMRSRIEPMKKIARTLRAHGH